MPEHAPRRPGLSRLLQEVISYDQDEQLPLPYKDHVIPPQPIALDSSRQNSPGTPSFNYKTPYDVADDGVNVPLLPLRAPQIVRLPLTRNVGTERIVHIDMPHSTGSDQGKDNKPVLDYRWTSPGTDDTEYDSPRRRFYPSSTEAHCAIEIPSPSPNLSTQHPPHPPLAGFRNRRRGTRSQRILRYHNGRN